MVFSFCIFAWKSTEDFSKIMSYNDERSLTNHWKSHKKLPHSLSNGGKNDIAQQLKLKTQQRTL